MQEKTKKVYFQYILQNFFIEHGSFSKPLRYHFDTTCSLELTLVEVCIAHNYPYYTISLQKYYFFCNYANF